MFAEWNWGKFARTLLAGLLAGVVGGAIFETLAPSIGLLRASAIGGLVGFAGAAVTEIVENF